MTSPGPQERHRSFSRDRIGIIGMSMCGEAVVRAAAFEHRLAAVVPDPGIVNAWLAWPAAITRLFADGATEARVNQIWQTDVIRISTRGAVQRDKRAELFDAQFMLAGRAGEVFTDLWDLGQAVIKVNCSSVAGQVTSPTLLPSTRPIAWIIAIVALHRLSGSLSNVTSGEASAYLLTSADSNKVALLQEAATQVSRQLETAAAVVAFAADHGDLTPADHAARGARRSSRRPAHNSAGQVDKAALRDRWARRRSCHEARLGSAAVRSEPSAPGSARRTADLSRRLQHRARDRAADGRG